MQLFSPIVALLLGIPILLVLISIGVFVAWRTRHNRSDTAFSPFDEENMGMCGTTPAKPDAPSVPPANKKT